MVTRRLAICKTYASRAPPPVELGWIGSVRSAGRHGRWGSWAPKVFMGCRRPASSDSAARRGHGPTCATRCHRPSCLAAPCALSHSAGADDGLPCATAPALSQRSTGRVTRIGRCEVAASTSRCRSRVDGRGVAAISTARRQNATQSHKPSPNTHWSTVLYRRRRRQG